MRVVMDDREARLGMADFFQPFPWVCLEIGRLSTGDYVVENRLGVERKTAPDLIASLRDGRLFRQASRLQAAYPQCAFVIENLTGALRRLGRPDGLLGALCHLAIARGIPLLYSHGPRHTAKLVLFAGRQLFAPSGNIAPRPSRPISSRRARRLFVLQGFPGIGPRLAGRLLDHFGTVGAALAAPADELALVWGIGRGRSSLIRELLDE